MSWPDWPATRSSGPIDPSSPANKTLARLCPSRPIVIITGIHHFKGPASTLVVAQIDLSALGRRVELLESGLPTTPATQVGPQVSAGRRSKRLKHSSRSLVSRPRPTRSIDRFDPSRAELGQTELERSISLEIHLALRKRTGANFQFDCRSAPAARIMSQCERAQRRVARPEPRGALLRFTLSTPKVGPALLKSPVELGSSQLRPMAWCLVRRQRWRRSILISRCWCHLHDTHLTTRRIPLWLTCNRLSRWPANHFIASSAL